MHCSLFKPGMPRMILSKLNLREGLCTGTKFVLKFTYLFRTFNQGNIRSISHEPSSAKHDFGRALSRSAMELKFGGDQGFLSL